MGYDTSCRQQRYGDGLGRRADARLTVNNRLPWGNSTHTIGDAAGHPEDPERCHRERPDANITSGHLKHRRRVKDWVECL